MLLNTTACRRLLPLVRPYAPLLVAACTAAIVAIDVNFPIGFAPWLPYFVLAFATARLNEPRTLILATVFWSLAIMGEPLLHWETGDLAVQGLFNRTLGIIALWIFTGLLAADIIARRDLRQTTTFSESLFEHLPNMVFVKDARDLRFVRFNKAGEDLLGYTRSELLGKTDYDFFSEQEADFFTGKDRETLHSGRMTDIQEEPIQTKHKGLRLLHTKKIPICDSTGAPQYLLGISEDVTERKEAEAALVRARLAAEEANKAKSDFLANMSHEMRTPLTAIIGISDYLLRTDLAKEQRELVQRCIRASDGLLRLIEDLLLAAKTESGTLQLVSESFPLKETVIETTDLLRREVEDKGLELIVELAPSLPTQVQGDAHRLQQVLLNLVRNAAKFTEKGQITVRVVLSSDSHHTHLIQFTVADPGVGIDPQHCLTIFDRFTQADSCSDRHYGGVGLGLSICKRLVELMGGRIWVESAKGKGSRFFFTIPFKSLQEDSTRHLPATGHPVEAPAPQQAFVPPERGLTILLAEDSIESQEVMKLYLRGTPHRVDCASSGTRVVSLFKEGYYDLVFMDLQMPEMDGLSATRLIREWEQASRRSRTPIVALSANSMPEAQRESLEAGCDDYLTKPIKMEQLHAAIRRYTPSTPATPTFTQDAMDSTLELMRPKFLHNRQRDVDALQEAIGQRNFEQIRTIGHRIKGLAGSYGLDDIGRIGSTIEQAALAKNLALITQQAAQLADVLRHMQQTTATESNTTHRAA